MDALHPATSSIQDGAKRTVQFSNKSTDADKLTIEWFLEHNAVCCVCATVLDAFDCQNIKNHPRLDVVVCTRCYSVQERNDISASKCVWCGVEITTGASVSFRTCDSPGCSSKLCDGCLRANFSKLQVEAMCANWTCFDCDPQSIRPHQLYAECLMEFARKFRRPVISDRGPVIIRGHTTRAKLLNSIKELLLQLKPESTAPPSTENLNELIQLAQTLRTELSTLQIGHVKHEQQSQPIPMRAEAINDRSHQVSLPEPDNTGTATRVAIKEEICDDTAEAGPSETPLPASEREDTILLDGNVKRELEATQPLPARRERSSDADSDETVNLQPAKTNGPLSETGIEDDELNRLLGNINRRHYGNNSDPAERSNVAAPTMAPSNVRTYEEPFLSSDEESEGLNVSADHSQASCSRFDGPLIVLSSEEEFLDYNSPDGDDDDKDDVPSPEEFETPEGSSDELSAEENGKISSGNETGDASADNRAGIGPAKVIARRGSLPSIPRISPTPHHSGKKISMRESRSSKSVLKRKRHLDEDTSDGFASELESVGSDGGKSTDRVKLNAKAPPPSEKKQKRDGSGSARSDSDTESRDSRRTNPSPKKFTKQCVKASNTHAPAEYETCIISSDDEDFIEPIRKPVVKAEAVAPQSGRRNIREMMSSAQLSKATLDANSRERDRRKRIEEMQRKYNQFEQSEQATGGDVKCVLEFDLNTKEPLVEVHPQLSQRMKTHQLEGVKFLYQNLVEKASKLQEDSPGTGAILGHCMGLGKTFQIVCFLHTLMTHPKLKDHFKTVLVVSPLNVIATWQEEISRWVERDPKISEKLTQYSLHKQNQQTMRLALLSKWERSGGIMLMTPNLLTSLLGRETAAGKRAKTKHFADADMTQQFRQYLCDPGPRVLIVDEGHTLKKSSTQLTQIVDTMIKTTRKILLTGTPLQNNLTEYFTMVSIVSPHLLGTRAEYKNRFENPITNGQYKNSTPADIRKMRQRACVLKKLLENVVHRRDLSVLQSILPPRHDYVITIRLSDLQQVLYKNFLEILISKAENEGIPSLRRLLQDFVSLRSVWTHPKLLTMPKKFLQKRKTFATVSDMLGFDSITTDAVSEDPYKDWFKPFIVDEKLEDPTLGPKIFILCDIIQNCGMIGDKLVVFCTQLSALDLVEFILGLMNENRIGEGRWIIEKDYFRMDGKTSAEDRHRYFKMFNDPSNTRARLFLVSTNAGKLGSTLIGANRMVLLDTSWNPADDNQAVYRIYRIGQTKPVFIYRFVAFGTMEEKIYARNILKESTALRVLDDSNMERHFTHEDVRDLYTFTPFDEAERKTPGVPKDKMLAELILRHPELIVNVHEHQQLLQNLEDDLSEEDRRVAWDEYQREKEEPPPPPPANPIPFPLPVASAGTNQVGLCFNQLTLHEQVWTNQATLPEQKRRMCVQFRNTLTRCIDILDEYKKQFTRLLSDSIRRHGDSPMANTLAQKIRSYRNESQRLEARVAEVDAFIHRATLTPIPRPVLPPQFR